EADKILPWPPTNFVAVAERVSAGRSLKLIERSLSDQRPAFLIEESWRSDNEIFDVVRRPHPVCDILPWRLSGGRLPLAARHGHPRPIACAAPRGPTMIDGTRWGGYLVEPVTGMMRTGASPDEIIASTAERTGIDPAHFGTIEAALTYYPSPGGIDEVV